LLRLFKRYQPPTKERRTSIRRTLEQTIFDGCKVNEKAKIFVTGHSLGGALALLAGRVIINLGIPDSSEQCEQSQVPRGSCEQTGVKNRFHNRLDICTFAAPRVGDPNFARVFDEFPVVRYVNTEDVVPTVPPATGKLLGVDMKLTPEGMREFKRKGVRNFNDLFAATNGAAFDLFNWRSILLSVLKFLSGKGTLEQYLKRTAPYTHVGECRSFTISQDSVSFNHNHQNTYRDGVTKYHDQERDRPPTQEN
jgi:hypothetical protein